MVRRFLVVLAAVVLGASVLVVAGSPASAANTASEVLSDHDDDAATPVVREFAGANRYATSVALARAFVNSVGSGGFADSVIVASGVSVVDAAAAAGLAASKSAPVVLTTPNRLSRVVENFIVDEFISEVFIVGGLEAVSQSVEDALADLATVRTVTRLSGPDRYATSVALAEEMGTPGVYCDSGEVTAILVNVDSTFADVIAVGPLAYALELPVLLTRANALPDVVSGYLVDAEVERVVIVGGETAVSEAVVADVTAVGVSNVVRLTGDSRYGTALAILDALEDCATITVSSSPAALINGDSPADGVAAAPLLGSGLGGGTGVTPVLLVQTDQLPAETRDYLASIPLRNRASQLIDQSIVAIGGTAVVSQAVMQAAINAAITSKPLTATIKLILVDGVAGSQAVITFSGIVDEAMATNLNNYRIAGIRPFASDTFTFEGGTTAPGTTAVTIDLRFEESFTEGTEITIVGGKIKGAGSDNRYVEGVTYTVPTASSVRDNVRPRVQITAAEGAHELRVQVIEQNPAGLTSDLDFSKVRLNGEPLPWYTETRDKVTYAASAAPAALTQASLDNHNAGRASNPWKLIPEINGSVTIPNQDGVDLPVAAGFQAFSREIEDQRTPLSAVKTTSSLLDSFASPTNFIICLFGKEGTRRTDPACVETAPVASGPTTTGMTSPNSDSLPRETISGVTVVIRGRKVTTQSYVRSGSIQTLIAGDRITFEEGAFTDTSGNPSRTTTFVVKDVDDAPRVTRASVTKPVVYDSNGATPGGEALAQWWWREYIYDCNGNTGTGSSSARCLGFYYPRSILEITKNYLTITAKSDGIAAGAAGNSWRVEWSELPDALNDDGVPVVQVNVPVIRRTIQIKFDNEATLENVLTALLANETLSENFTVTSDGLTGSATLELLEFNIADSVTDSANVGNLLDLPASGSAANGRPPSGDGATGIDVTGTIPSRGRFIIQRGAPSITSNGARGLMGGESAVTVSLTYNKVLETFKFSETLANPADEAGTLRVVNAGNKNYPSATGWDNPLNVREVLHETYTVADDISAVRTALLTQPTLVTEIVFVLHSDVLSSLPVRGDSISLPAGVAEDYEGGTSVVFEQELRAG